MSEFTRGEWTDWLRSPQTEIVLKDLDDLGFNILQSAMKAPVGKRDSFVDQAIGVNLALTEILKRGEKEDE